MSSSPPPFSPEPVLHYWNIKARNYSIAVIARAGASVSNCLGNGFI